MKSAQQKMSQPAPALEDELRFLMIHSLAGDKLKYATFLEKVRALISSYLTQKSFSRQLSRESIEELVQDVLISIHNKKHTYQTERPILPWIYTIAKYRLIDQIRADGRKSACIPFDADLEDMTAAPTIISRTSEIDDALLSLSNRQREVLFLTKAEGHSLKDVAAQTGMSVASVKVTVHRAIKFLREQKRRGKERKSGNS